MLLTISQTAARLAVSDDTIARYIESGTLTPVYLPSPTGGKPMPRIPLSQLSTLLTLPAVPVSAAATDGKGGGMLTTWYCTWRNRWGVREGDRRQLVGSEAAANARLNYMYMLKAQGKDPWEEAQNERDMKRKAGITLDAWFIEFMAGHGTEQSPKMQASYRSSWGHLQPWFGRGTLASVKQGAVEEYMDRRKQDGASHSTINTEVSCLRAMVQYAVKKKRLAVNPLIGLERLPVNDKRHVNLTLERVEAFIHAWPEPYRDVIEFLIVSTFRLNNALRLRTDQITFATRMIQGQGIPIAVVTHKTKTGIKTQELAGAAVELLRRNCRGEWAFEVNGKRVTEGMLYKPFHRIRQEMQLTVMQAGKEHPTLLRLHDLRHIGATLLDRQGVDRQTIQAVLAHSDITTTGRYITEGGENVVAAMSQIQRIRRVG